MGYFSELIFSRQGFEVLKPELCLFLTFYQHFKLLLLLLASLLLVGQYQETSASSLDSYYLYQLF